MPAAPAPSVPLGQAGDHAGWVRRAPSRPAPRRRGLAVWAGSAGDGTIADPVVPDGSMDLMWDGTRLFVAGPDTTWWVPAGPPTGSVVGIRLRPGRGAAVLGLPATALLDERPDLAALWGPVARWEDRLAEATSVAQAAAVLEQLLEDRLRRTSEFDRTVDAAVATMGDRAGPGLVGDLSDELGVGERQLLRRFRAAVGYGPLRLHRVLRFQRFLELLAADPECDLAAAAARTGYADQSHLTREAVRLAGRPPGQLRERARRAGPGAA